MEQPLVPEMAGGRNTIAGALPGNTGAGIVGSGVFLDGDGDGQLDPREASTQTDATGRYRFLVTPGTYVVRLVVPRGWTPTSPPLL